MSGITIFGIRNCDKVKKTLKWFEAQDIAFDFYDYKKKGVDGEVLQLLLDQYGWSVVLNTRGTTWRKLSDDVKAGMDNENAARLAEENPSIIKRPVVKKDHHFHVGYNEDGFRQLLSE